MENDLPDMPLNQVVPHVVGPLPNMGKGDKHQHDHEDPKDRFRRKHPPRRIETPAPPEHAVDLNIADEIERGVNVDVQA